jgi:F0F1-type ATP synthase assembly protein I
VRYDRNALSALGSLGGLGFIVAGGALLGWWAGTWIDRRWGTEPWGLLGCLLLGMGAAIFECWLVLKRYIERENRKNPRGPS